MTTPRSILTLWVDPHAPLEPRGTADKGLTYPTPEELRTHAKYQRGAPIERLRRCYVIEPGGCWRWIKGHTTNGYGHFSINHIYYQAHVIVWIAERGTPPAGLQPDHLCRNRWCVNPDCIEWVTRAVNVQRGSQATLTPEQVATIKARGKAAGVRAMAVEYGVNHSTISRILSGRIWVETPASVEAAA